MTSIWIYKVTHTTMVLLKIVSRCPCVCVLLWEAIYSIYMEIPNENVNVTEV